MGDQLQETGQDSHLRFDCLYSNLLVDRWLIQHFTDFLSLEKVKIHLVVIYQFRTALEKKSNGNV